MPQSKFGDELRRLRRQASLSLADLADTLGCSIAYVSDVERGRKNPPGAAAIVKLVECMGCREKLSYLLRLAAQSRQAVEISVENKTEEVTDMLVALARRCDEGSLSNDLADMIKSLLEKEKPQ